MKRFFDKVKKTKNGCWIWIAGVRGKSGYGCFKFEGRVVDAHRVSYTLNIGTIPEGMLVCHKCDVRLCVNPDHLFLGTYSDNMKDCYDKGRMSLPTGSRFKNKNIPYNNTLSAAEVITVKQLIKIRGKTSLKKLAENTGYKYQLLRDINCGRIYN